MTALGAPDARLAFGALAVRLGPALAASLDLGEIAAETGLGVEKIGAFLADWDAAGIIFATVSPSGAVSVWMREDFLASLRAESILAAVTDWRRAALVAAGRRGAAS
jgi:hypothetical protein